MVNQNESEVECVCEECGDEYPIERRRVAYHLAHLCVSCAEAVPVPNGQFTLVLINPCDVTRFMKSHAILKILTQRKEVCDA